MCKFDSVDKVVFLAFLFFIIYQLKKVRDDIDEKKRIDEYNRKTDMIFGHRLW